MSLKERLDAAEAAYHRLLLGDSVVEFVDQNGERVRYAAVNRAALQNYIQQLKNEIDGSMSAVAPMRVWGGR